jgi:hypothetical protein
MYRRCGDTMNKIHYTGIFPAKMTPIGPLDLVNHHYSTFKSICDIYIKNAALLSGSVQHAQKHVGEGIAQYKYVENGLTSDVYNTAVFAASFSRIAFAYFESEAYDNETASIPVSVDFKPRDEYRRAKAAEFKRLIQVKEALMDPAFQRWFARLLSNVNKEWKLNIANGPLLDSIRMAAVYMYALHKLVRAFQQPPEITVFRAPTDMDSEEGAKNVVQSYMYCTAFGMAGFISSFHSSFLFPALI